jgi:PAS domain S-box-containing protein/tape measure domain-containing protein
MQIAPLPADEASRLRALSQYQILDTEPEDAFDDLVALATTLCETPIALVTLIDDRRQWFKSKVGTAVAETPRDIAFCSHTILQPDILIVPDALADERFAANPLVIGEPHIRFYAGVPLILPSGHVLGTLCVIDVTARELSVKQIESLQALGRQAVAQLELRQKLLQAECITQVVCQSEAALCESEERFRTMANSVPVLIWMDGPNQESIFCNTTWLKFTGRSLDQEIGQGWKQGLHPEDREHWSNSYAAAFAAKAPYTFEYRLKRADGAYRWLLETGVPRFLPDGNFAGFIGSCVDITDRKTMEQDSQLLQTVTRAIVASPDFHSALEIALQKVCEATQWEFGEAWIPNLDRTVMECSPAWYSKTHRLREFRQQSETFTFHPGAGIPGRVWSSKQTEWHQDISQSTEIIYPRVQLALAAGLKATLGVPLLANDEVITVLVFYMFEARAEDQRLIDLIAASTELGLFIQRKQAEEEVRKSLVREQELNRFKSNFIANVSHELRTPLTSVLGLSTVLLQQYFGPLNKKQEQYLSLIHESGEHLLNLINDLLDLAKIEAGKQELNKVAVDVAELCQSAIEMIAVRAIDKQQELSLSLPVAVESIVVDQQRTLQILLNYLSNAVKFTPPGGVITLSSRLASGSELEDDLEKLEGASRDAANGAQTIADGAGKARSGIGSASEAIGGFSGKLERQRAVAAGFESAIKSLADAGTLLNVYKEAGEIVDGFFGDLEQNFNAAKSFQTLNNQLQLVSTSSRGAAGDLSYIGNLTNKLGINFDAAAKGYVQFQTAAKLANLTNEETKETFEGVAQAASVMGLSTSDTEGVFLALQQVLSSGNVQLEELNQIAERVPGTFDAAAAALGVTTAELKGLISTGTVDSADFVTKFAVQLKNFTEAGVVDGMNSAEAAVQRFNNSLGDFQVAAGDAWVKVGTPALNTLAQALEFATQNEELFSSAVDAIGVAAALKFAESLFIANKATISLGLELLKSGQAMNFLNAQFGPAIKTIASYGATIALSYAATILFYRNLDRVKDSAVSTRAAIASADKSLRDLADASGGASQGIQNALPKEPPPLDWIDTGVHGIKHLTEETGLLGLAFGSLLKFTPVGIGVELNKLANFLKTGRYEIVTASEKALNDQLGAIGDFSERAQTVLGKSLDLRSLAAQGQGPINELRQIDVLLKQIEQRKLGVDPKDAKAIASIKAEETDLLKRRADAQKEVLATQSAVNNSLTQAKQELQNLDPNKLGTKGYEEAKQQLTTQVNLLEKEKGKLDEVAKTATTTAETIATKFDEASKQLDLSFANTQASIAEALAAGGITEEQARQQNLDAEKDYLTQKLKSNKDYLTQLKTELERDSKLRAVDPSAAGLLDTKQKKEYEDQVAKLETESAQTRLQLATKTREGKKQISDQELADLRDANAAAEAVAKRSEDTRIAAIKQRQAAGQITEQQATQQIADVQKAGIADEITLQQSRLKQVKDLRARGVIDAKTATQQESDILNSLSNLNLQRIDQELQAKKTAEQDALKSVEDASSKAAQAIAKSQSDRITAIRSAVLQGQVDEQEAAQQTAAIQSDTTNRTIVTKQSELEKIRQLRAQGTISATEAAKREEALITEVGNLRQQQIDAEIKAQQDLLKSLDDKESREEGVTKRTQQSAIAAIRERQAAGVTGEQSSQQQITQLNQQTIGRNLAAKQQELAQLQQLRATGQITIEEGLRRQEQLEGDIAQLREGYAQSDIDTTKGAIQEKRDIQQAAADAEISSLELQKQALEDQNNLLSAQSGLIQAQSDLEQQRLQFKIEDAEKTGNTFEAEQLRKQAIDEQIASQQQQNEIARQQLDLKHEQVALELQEKQLQAELAAGDADRAITEARLNGESEAKIRNLEQLRDIRYQQVDALKRQADAQQRINDLENRSLSANQQLKKEQLDRAKAKEAENSSTAASFSGSAGGSAGFGGSAGTGRGTTISATGSDIAKLEQAQSTINRSQSTSDLLSQSVGNNNPFIGQLLAASGRSDVLKLQELVKVSSANFQGFQGQNQAQAIAQAIDSGQLSSQEASKKLDELIAAVKQTSLRPNLSISNLDNLGLAGQVYSDISRDSMRGAGL